MKYIEESLERYDRFRLGASDADWMPRAQTITNIPKIVYQSWVSKKKMPSKMAETVQSWIDMNPDYEVQFFNDTEQRLWVQEHCQEYWPAWRDMELPAARANLFRYCILHTNGGVWADIDMQPKKALDEFLNHAADIVLVHDKGMGKDNYLYNAFMASAPRHPVLKRAMDIVQEHYEKQLEVRIVDSTGSGVLWRAVNDTFHGELMPPTFLGFDTIHKVQYLSFDPPMIRTKENGDVLRAKYTEYLGEVQSVGVEPHHGRTVTWANVNETETERN